MAANRSDDGRARQLAKMERQMKQWSAQLGVLRARAGRVGAAGGKELRQQVDELIALHKSAKLRLEELVAASAETWQESKVGLVDGWTKLASAVETAWRGAGPDRAL